MTTPNLDEPLLAPSFDALRRANGVLNAPPEVEAALLAAFNRQFPAKRWYQRLSALRWGMASGVCAALGTMAFLLLALMPPALDHASHPAAFADEAGDFIALESRERIELEAAPQLVETVLPRTALAGVALALTPQSAGDSVRAQMLIGADGQPLALRLLPL